MTAQLWDPTPTLHTLADPGVLVTLTLPGGNLVGTTTAVTNGAGLVTFSTLSITTTGTFQFTASSAVGSAPRRSP